MPSHATQNPPRYATARDIAHAKSSSYEATQTDAPQTRESPQQESGFEQRLCVAGLPQTLAKNDKSRLVGRNVAETQADKTAKTQPVAQRLFKLRIRQPKPLLKHNTFDHGYQRPVRPAAFGIIVGKKIGNGIRQPLPWNSLLALIKKSCRSRAAQLGGQSIQKRRLNSFSFRN